MNRTRIAVAVVIALCLWAVPATAAPPEGVGGGKPEGVGGGKPDDAGGGKPEGTPGVESVSEPGKPAGVGATPPRGADVAACRPAHEPSGETAEATPEADAVELEVQAASETAESTPEAGGGHGASVRECLFGVGGPLHDLVGNVHAQAARAVVDAGIAQGYDDGTFRPDSVVSRAQMASFVARALSLDGDPDAAPADAQDSVHAGGVAAVVEAGIALGYADGTFRPHDAVTRGQMASFLMRALDLAVAGDAVPADAVGSVHADAIAALVAAGISSGFADGTFGPDLPVSRGQMASFLARALGLL